MAVVRQTVPMRLVLLLGLALAGCAAPGRWDYLTAQQQQRFSRCQRHVMPTRCGAPSSAVYDAMCGREAMEEYAELPEKSQQRWLLENGCPDTMVHPARYAEAR